MVIILLLGGKDTGLLLATFTKKALRKQLKNGWKKDDVKAKKNSKEMKDLLLKLAV